MQVCLAQVTGPDFPSAGQQIVSKGYDSQQGQISILFF